MATGTTVVDQQNKLIRFTQEINREYVRENMFSPYMGEEMTSIIRVRNELKQGGDTINLPTVRRLKTGIIGGSGTAVSQGQLQGSEEVIDNYGQRVKVDWARNAVVTNAAEIQKDSADIFGEAKPLLSDWGKELQRDDLIQALMACPSVTPPATGVRINGTLYNLASAGQLNTWNTENSDRVLYGATLAHFNATHATALGNITATAVDSLTGKNLSLLKRVAMNADPHIRPFKTRNGYEYYVAFTGTNGFRDLKNDLNYTATSSGGPNLLARPREGNQVNGAPDTPLWQDGDQLYDGVIVRQVPEITSFVTNVWTALKTAGATGTARVEPVFFCGQQAATLCWGQMAKPTFLKEDDYQFKTGVGIQMCFGTAKIFSAPVNTSANLKQLGVVTGFFWSPGDP